MCLSIINETLDTLEMIDVKIKKSIKKKLLFIIKSI